MTTYRAWNLKPLDRSALKELTAAIAQQNTEELESRAMETMDAEPWSEEKYQMTMAAQPMSFFSFSVKCLFSIPESISVHWDALTMDGQGQAWSCRAEIRPYCVKPLDHTKVCSATLFLSGRISASEKLQGTCQRWIFE